MPNDPADNRLYEDTRTKASAHFDPHRESYRPRGSRRFAPLANLLIPTLPGLPRLSGAGLAGSYRTYAPSPVWRDSTTKEVRFVALPKKKAVRLYHKARQFERQTRQPGKQDGALGRNGLAVLHALLFDFLNYTSGRLEPAYSSIARKACISVRSAARGLANLRRAGVLYWQRRAAETRDERGRFCLEQDTNAYGVIPPTQWPGFLAGAEAPPPHPTTWGATPPLPSAVENAAIAAQDGLGLRSMIARLEDDPADTVAAELARLGRAIEARESK